MIRLFELTHDYMRFCNTATLKQKKQDLKDITELLMRERQLSETVTKKQLKQIFCEIYKNQLDLILQHGLDEKKQALLKKLLLDDLHKK